MDTNLMASSDFKTTHVFKSVDPFVDVGNLLIEDLEPFDMDQFKEQGDEYVKSLTRDNVQFLFNKIWELPSERLEDAIVAILPETVCRIPREKLIPKMRDLTRWERYAKLKGIRKMKKGRMSWSEETQAWQPRWGYRRAKDDTKDWVIEIPRQKDPYKDYIGERVEKKKERVAKNELQRLKNIRNMAAKSEEFPGMQPEQKSSEQLARQVSRATSSTASLGKFTQRLHDEKRPKNEGKRRKFLPNESVGNEKDKQLGILKRIQSKVTPLNVDMAAGKFVQDEQRRARESNNLTDIKNSRRNKLKSRGAIRKRSRDQKGGRNKTSQPGRKNVKKSMRKGKK